MGMALVFLPVLFVRASCVRRLCAQAVCASCVRQMCAPVVCTSCVHQLCAPAVCAPAVCAGCARGCVRQLCVQAVCASCVRKLCAQAVASKKTNRCVRSKSTGSWHQKRQSLDSSLAKFTSGKLRCIHSVELCH